MERETRVELATCSLEGCRSTNWATPARCWYIHLIKVLKIGGEGRIRTFETFVAELQSAPFDRSGTSPFLHLFSVLSLTQSLKLLKWCRHTDSNCGPTDYKSVALPTELCRRFLVFRTFRTFRIGTVCSLAKLWILASVFLKKNSKNSQNQSIWR